MKSYNLAIKVLIDRPDSITDPNSMFHVAIKKLGGLEKALPIITQAFIEMSQRFDRELHFNKEGEIIKGFIKDLPCLRFNLYVTWCENYKNFLYSKDGSKLVAYGGKKENKPYIISIEQGRFFMNYV
ncbi:MAG: hypothetical protein ACPLXC_02805 [Candidatus Pacearchaeota archaeon]